MSAGALSDSLSMGQNYIGTEHLVLALFRDADGLAAQILAMAGASHADDKAKIATILVGMSTKC